MLYKEETHLAGIIFHELAHQQVYIDDDSAYNEAFATAVELEGVRRWLLQKGDKAANERYRTYKIRQKDFNNMLRVTRNELKQLYANEKDLANWPGVKNRSSSHARPLSKTEKEMARIQWL